MDNNNRFFYKELGNRLMVEFEEILNLYEKLLEESKNDYKTYGEESREFGERKYEILRMIRERTEPLKQDFAFFAEQMSFPTGKMEWDLPFDEYFEDLDIEVDPMVMDRYFDGNAEGIYKDIRKQAGNAKVVFMSVLADFFYLCPCCGNYLFTENGNYEICGICKWENDKVQNADPAFKGGANKECLNDYRIRFRSSRIRM